MNGAFGLSRVEICARISRLAAPNGVLLCAVKVDFGGGANPLIGALPDEVCVSLANEPQLTGLVELIVAEMEVTRCGGHSIQTRLCGAAVVLAIRKAIAIGTIDAGLLAGLAHPELHRTKENGRWIGCGFRLSDQQN